MEKNITIQQLRYMIAIAENGSISKAAQKLFIAQSSLSTAIKEIESLLNFTIFIRNHQGITLTKQGEAFLGYARNVVFAMDNLQAQYLNHDKTKVKFGVSSQHYTFTENAFVELVSTIHSDKYEFFYNATSTHQVMLDVKNRNSEIGVLFLSEENEMVLKKKLQEYFLTFHPLFSAKPHVFIQKNHPLASQKLISIESLKMYPRLNFVQGNYESVFYSEEILKKIESDKQIFVNDRGAIVRFMLGLNAYTISSGILPKYLQNDQIVAIPLDSSLTIHIGYIQRKDEVLSALATRYIEELMHYKP